MKIAGIMQTRDYNKSCLSFDFLKRICDHVFVLDHNSHRLFPHINQCDAYMLSERKGLWNCTANLTTLFYQAFSFGCDWVVRLDDDMIPNAHFQTRENVNALIETAKISNVDIVNLPLLDLWASPLTYRTDGIWGAKIFPVIQRNWMFDDSIKLADAEKLRLHQIIYPANKKPLSVVTFQEKIYHTGCMTKEKRRARFNKYQQQDENREFQPDYSYMLKEDGAALEAVPQSDLLYFPTALRLECKWDW